MQNITVAQLIAQLQQFDSSLPIDGFAHSTATQLELYSVEFVEGFVDDEDNIPDSVTLHFNV